MFSPFERHGAVPGNAPFPTATYRGVDAPAFLVRIALFAFGMLCLAVVGSMLG